jgi:hypothetical protein
MAEQKHKRVQHNSEIRGNCCNWWTDAANKEFCLAEYSAVESVHVCACCLLHAGFMFGLFYLTRYLPGAECGLYSRQSLSYSRISHNFMEPEGSLRCSEEPAAGP